MIRRMHQQLPINTHEDFLPSEVTTYPRAVGKESKIKQAGAVIQLTKNIGGAASTMNLFHHKLR